MHQNCVLRERAPSRILPSRMDTAWSGKTSMAWLFKSGSISSFTRKSEEGERITVSFLGECLGGHLIHILGGDDA